jgi:predicted alpha/beta hydrolase
VYALEGYDVWLGNNRGTTHSRRHKRLDPDYDQQYWDFSFIELGKYDLPAMIKYVLNKTENKKLSFVAHSQGTTQMFFALTENEELSNSINLFVALGPVVRLHFSHDSFLG